MAAQSYLDLEILKTRVSCTVRAVQNGGSDPRGSQTGKEQLLNVVFFSLANLSNAALSHTLVFSYAYS